MRQISNLTLAYAALAGFCILTAARDVISESFFKGRLYEASPIFVLFVYSVVTQLAALILMVFYKQFGSGRSTPVWPLRKELGWLNFFTLTAFLFYFLAISLPLGAAINSFVDYGTGPIFTALVAMFLTQTRFDRTFALSTFVSVAGIAILAAPRLEVTSVSLPWLVGLMLATLSSLSSACYRVYFKILLEKGLSKSAIVFWRLLGTTLVLGAGLSAQPSLFRPDLILEIAIVGALGFTLPLFLALITLQRVAIRSYAMLLFCVPVITYGLSAAFGYAQFHFSDPLAAGLIFAAVALHERREYAAARK